MKTTYFILIPAKSPGYYGGVLIMDREQVARELAVELGGAYVPVTYGLN